MKAKKELSTGLALLGFLLPLAVLLTLIFQGVSIMLGLTAAICVEGLFGIYLRALKRRRTSPAKTWQPF